MLSTNQFHPLQGCGLGFQIASAAITLTIGLGGGLTWLASLVARWRGRDPSLVEKAKSSRSRRLRAQIGEDARLNSSRFFLISAAVLFLIGFVFHFVVSPVAGFLFMMRADAFLMLLMMALGAVALVRSAMLAWQGFGPGGWVLRVGATLLCSLLLGSTYLVADNLNEMYQDQCGIFLPHGR